MAIQYTIQKKTHCCYIESIEKRPWVPFDVDRICRICVEYRSIDDCENVYSLYFISRNVRRNVSREGKIKDERLSEIQRNFEEKKIQIVTENDIFFNECVFHVFSRWDELNDKCCILDKGEIEINDSDNPVPYDNVTLYTTPLLHSKEDEYINDYVTKSFLCKTDESVQRLLEKRKRQAERIRKLKEAEKNSIIIANTYSNAPSFDDEESIMWAISNGYGDMIGF